MRNPARVGGATLSAEYNGKCKCGRRFLAGSWIKWDPDSRKVIECDGCRPIRPVDRQTQRTINNTPSTFVDDGTIDWVTGQIIWRLTPMGWVKGAR